MQLPPTETGRRHFDTVIIGAGISGLGCAEKLFSSSSTNKHSLVVLEGRDRIGGRINAVTIDGNRLDTGANWIHGTGTDSHPNPILRYVPASRVKELTSWVAFSPPARGSSQSDTPARNAGDAPLIIPSDVSTNILTALWQLVGSLRETAQKLPPEKSRDTTMLSAVLEDPTFKEAFKSIPEPYHEALAGLPQMLEGMEAASLNDISAETPQGRPGMSLAEFDTDGFEGAQVFLRDGYISVIKQLAQDLLAHDRIHLGTTVHCIRWDRSPIEILTNNGTYTARDVICTVPLGVLQHRLQSDIAPSEESFFAPALPRDTRAAVDGLGFGTLNKIFMVYDAPWWLEEPFAAILQKGIAMIDGSTVPSEPDGWRGFTPEWTGIQIAPPGVAPGPFALFVVNLHPITGAPVLSAFVACANARRVEALSDADAGALVHRTLAAWCGIAPPPPKHVHVTRWAQDAFSRGSYSHMVAGRADKNHRARFATPLVNAAGATLRFAGEHTSVDDFGTAHGALLSGWREADALIAERAAP